MIYSQIYKHKIKKAEEKLYDLWGDELIRLQNQYIKVIKSILIKQYKDTLKELEKNTEVKYNDLFIDQTQFIEKDFWDNLEKFFTMLSKAFNFGKKQLDKMLSKEVTVEANFWLEAGDALAYARKYGASQVKNIDENTRKRINDLVVQGLDKGWWYMKLADALKQDFAFSEYRARLIASHEIGIAYIEGKTMQFEKYRSEFWKRGYKKWISHRDDRTNTEICLPNDDQGWIEYDAMFQSGHMKPLGHIGCRCNVVFRLFNPND